MSRSETLFANAQKHIPGGVNSPVRAFKSVGGTPLFFKHAEGAYVTDEDDNPLDPKDITKIKKYSMNIHFKIKNAGGSFVSMIIDPDTGNGCGNEP